jgi:hypothetical protein
MRIFKKPSKYYQWLFIPSVMPLEKKVKVKRILIISTLKSEQLS